MTANPTFGSWNHGGSHDGDHGDLPAIPRGRQHLHFDLPGVGEYTSSRSKQSRTARYEAGLQPPGTWPAKQKLWDADERVAAWREILQDRPGARYWDERFAEADVNDELQRIRDELARELAQARRRRRREALDYDRAKALEDKQRFQDRTFTRHYRARLGRDLGFMSWLEEAFPSANPTPLLYEIFRHRCDSETARLERELAESA